MVRCKMLLNAIEKVHSGQGKFSYNIKMNPVYSDKTDDPNKKWWDYTPGGEFRLTTVNEKAVAELEVGQYYYIDISKAE